MKPYIVEYFNDNWEWFADFDTEEEALECVNVQRTKARINHDAIYIQKTLKEYVPEVDQAYFWRVIYFVVIVDDFEGII